MNRELNNLSTLFLIAFGLVVLGSIFWAVIVRDNLLAREDNPRRVLAEQNIVRGSIYDRNGRLLAETTLPESRSQGATRYYAHPESVSAVGYYSYQFGVVGLEEGYNAWLRGDDLRDLETITSDALFNRDVVGGDLRSTLDLDLQTALFDALQDKTGAAILVEVPSGAVRAMVSQPTYDPNQTGILQQLIDDQSADPRQNSRLLNRVVNGQYQPGAALQPLLMSLLLAAGTSPETTPSSAIETTELPLNLDCMGINNPPTLAESFISACQPAFFAVASQHINENALADAFDAAGFFDLPVLQGFPNSGDIATTLAMPDDLAGQGHLTITPLHMVQVVAAMLNDGRGVPTHLAEAQRYPAGAAWQSIEPRPTTIAMMQPANANTIQALLRQNSLGNRTYGHISHAYAGTKEYIWFLGWQEGATEETIVWVIVLEGNIGEHTATDIIQIVDAVMN